MNALGHQRPRLEVVRVIEGETSSEEPVALQGDAVQKSGYHIIWRSSRTWRALGVSADELIFDEGERVPAARILDKKLLEQFELLSALNPHDREAVQTIIESVIIKNRLEDVLLAKSDAAWAKEMRHVVGELRKGAAKYSDDEVDRLVNEAVTAVRGARPRQRVKVGA